MKALEKDRDAALRDGQRLRGRHPCGTSRRAGAGRAAEPGLPAAEIRPKHRGGVIAASLVLLSLLGGLAAVAAVQTAANARLAASLTSETKANTALNEANAELTRSRAAVEARYNLAVEAIKTFHTGVSEDFLLKEEKFKELRDRLLKSASDFYGKLGALLGKETDIASRRALAQSNFELADLTGKVGRNEDALAAHRAVLAAREALAAEPGAGVVAKVDVGRSLIAVAGLLEATGKTDEALATLPAVGVAAGRPGGCRSVGAGRAGGLPVANGLAPDTTGKSADALAAYRLARADQEALAAAPEASNDARHDLADTHQSHRRLLSETGKPAEAEAEFRKALAIYQKLADDNPAVTEFRSDLAASHNNLGVLLSSTGKPAEAEAEYRKALAIQQKLADDNPAVTDFRSDLANSHNNLGDLLSSTGKPAEAEAEYRKALATLAEAGRRQPRRHRLPQRPGGQPHQPRRPAVGDGQAGGGGGRVPQGAGAPAEAGRRQPRRHRIPQPPGGQPQQPRQPAVEDGQAGGGGGRVPQGAGDPAEAGRRQPRRHRLPQQPGGQPLQPRHPAVEHGQASGGGGRVPQGAGDPAEAGRRQPLRHRFPRWPVQRLFEGSCPPGVVWAGQGAFLHL